MIAPSGLLGSAEVRGAEPEIDPDFSPCPLCEQPARVEYRSEHTIFQVNCSICGRYEISGYLLVTLPLEPHWPRTRVALASAIRHRWLSGVQVRFENGGDVAVAIAENRLRLDALHRDRVHRPQRLFGSCFPASGADSVATSPEVTSRD